MIVCYCVLVYFSVYKCWGCELECDSLYVLCSSGDINVGFCVPFGTYVLICVYVGDKVLVCMFL